MDLANNVRGNHKYITHFPGLKPWEGLGRTQAKSTVNMPVQL